MNKAKAKYSHVIIVQASELNNKLEEVGINIYRVKIAYPFIKIATIKKAMKLFSKGLTYSSN